MPETPPSSSNVDSAADDRLVRAARTGAALARHLRTGVTILAGAAAVAGLLLWGLLWWPSALRPQSLLGAGATLLVFLTPAAVLGLFVQGLHDLLALPDRLSTRATKTADQSIEAVRATTTDAPDGLLDRLWALVRQLWALRTILSENRALLLRYGALLRFLTPGFLLLVLLAAGVSLLLVPVAVVAGLVAFLW
jgi:hypothetical protein